METQTYLCQIMPLEDLSIVARFPGYYGEPLPYPPSLYELGEVLQSLHFLQGRSIPKDVAP